MNGGVGGKELSPTRHCEQSEANQRKISLWIASSLALLAMTRRLKSPRTN